MSSRNSVAILLLFVFWNCNKKSSGGNTAPPPANFNSTDVKLNEHSANSSNYNVNLSPVLKFSFSTAVDRSTVNAAFSFADKTGIIVPYSVAYENNDNTVIIQPTANLKYLTKYSVSASASLKSTAGGSLIGGVIVNFATTIDSSRKFPVVSDSALLDLIQQQTFKYFWDFGHPVSGMARERNTSGETVTTGGTGFGIMAIPVAINRNFIARTEGLGRVQKIVSFLKNVAPKFHGAFSHWMNGTTGAVVPFATKDDGADLVETSYMMMGLLSVRQFFNGSDAAETNLRND